MERVAPHTHDTAHDLRLNDHAITTYLHLAFENLCCAEPAIPPAYQVPRGRACQKIENTTSQLGKVLIDAVHRRDGGAWEIGTEIKSTLDGVQTNDGGGAPSPDLALDSHEILITDKLE